MSIFLLTSGANHAVSESLDGRVSEENAVRFIDAFVERLPLGEIGFILAEPAARGSPGYHPGTLRKRYIYGYLDRVHSSRLDLFGGELVTIDGSTASNEARNGSKK